MLDEAGDWMSTSEGGWCFSTDASGGPRLGGCPAAEGWSKGFFSIGSASSQETSCLMARGGLMWSWEDWGRKRTGTGLNDTPSDLNSSLASSWSHGSDSESESNFKWVNCQVRRESPSVLFGKSDGNVGACKWVEKEPLICSEIYRVGGS